MTIKELQNVELNPAYAYVIGLGFPLFTVKKIEGKRYYICSVNHQPKKVEKDELLAHFKKVFNLFNQYEITPEQMELRFNKVGNVSISSKEGFSVIFDVEDMEDSEIDKIMLDLAQKIKESNNFEIRKHFIMGCIDGHGAADGVGKIAVDTKMYKLNILDEITKSIGINTAINRRNPDDTHNVQYRTDKSSLEDYCNRIGFYSVAREKLIRKML